jgi:hypothetical protein
VTHRDPPELPAVDVVGRAGGAHHRRSADRDRRDGDNALGSATVTSPTPPLRAAPRLDSSVDIDRVVSLGNAWATGAFRWEIREHAAFANDPMNLLAVDASANRQKGDGDAATWLPGNKGFR